MYHFKLASVSPQACYLNLAKMVKLTSKINPFSDSLGYNELYSEPDLAQKLETEPGRPCWINGYQLKPLEIKNISLFNTGVFSSFSKLVILFSNPENNEDVPNGTHTHIASNQIYFTNLSLLDLFNVFLLSYLAHFMAVEKAIFPVLFFLSSVCSSSYEH